MFYNKFKNDPVAEAVKKIMEAEQVDEALKGNQHKIDANHNGKIDAQDFKLLRSKKTAVVSTKKPIGVRTSDVGPGGKEHNVKVKEETESVEEGFGEMEKYLKDKKGPQPSGGSGVKKGTRYGGSKQKEEPKEDDELKSPSRRARDSAAVLGKGEHGVKEDVEQIDELSHDTLRSYVDKAKKENLPGKGGNRGVALLTPGTRDKGVHRAVDRMKKMKANEEVEIQENEREDADDMYFAKKYKGKVPMSQGEKNKVVAGLRAAMRKSYDNEMKGRAALAAARAAAARLAGKDKSGMKEEAELTEGKMDKMSLSGLWHKHAQHSYLADQGYGHGTGSMEHNHNAATAIENHVRKNYGNKVADDMVSHSDHHVAHAEYAGPGESEHHEKEMTKLKSKHKISEHDLREDVEQVDEVSPPGFKGTVKAMKKHKEIDNPFALAWYMKKKGYKSHKKADGTMKKEEVDSDKRTKDMISGPNKPTKQKDDVGPGADGKSTKVKFRGGPMGGD